jgi:RNA polymerase sigma-70 factor (ECF subfamily)
MNGTMRERPDESLVAEAKQGSLDAFSELVRRVQEQVYAVIFAMTRNHQDTDDLMQETFLSAYRALSGFAGRARFSTWTHRIAVNLTLNHLKRKGREKGRTSLDEGVAIPGQSGPAAPSPESASLGTELREKLDLAVAALAPIYRATFTLVVLQGMAHAEAAAVLGCSENTVSWRMHKARKMLQERLKNDL